MRVNQLLIQSLMLFCICYVAIAAAADCDDSTHSSAASHYPSSFTTQPRASHTKALVHTPAVNVWRANDELDTAVRWNPATATLRGTSAQAAPQPLGRILNRQQLCHTAPLLSAQTDLQQPAPKPCQAPWWRVSGDAYTAAQAPLMCCRKDHQTQLTSAVWSIDM